MTDIAKVELPEQGSQDRMNFLIGEITSAESPEKVSYLTRAMVSSELAKDALENGKLEPQQVVDFAQSLKDIVQACEEYGISYL